MQSSTQPQTLDPYTFLQDSITILREYEELKSSLTAQRVEILAEIEANSALLTASLSSSMQLELSNLEYDLRHLNQNIVETQELIVFFQAAADHAEFNEEIDSPSSEDRSISPHQSSRISVSNYSIFSRNCITIASESDDEELSLGQSLTLSRSE